MVFHEILGTQEIGGKYVLRLYQNERGFVILARRGREVRELEFDSKEDAISWYRTKSNRDCAIEFIFSERG
jgi:hypothetical protein